MADVSTGAMCGRPPDAVSSRPPPPGFPEDEAPTLPRTTTISWSVEKPERTLEMPHRSQFPTMPGPLSEPPLPGAAPLPADILVPSSSVEAPSPPDEPADISCSMCGTVNAARFEYCEACGVAPRPSAVIASVAATAAPPELQDATADEPDPVDFEPPPSSTPEAKAPALRIGTPMAVSHPEEAELRSLAPLAPTPMLRPMGRE
jgi:hypothetical protein